MLQQGDWINSVKGMRHLFHCLNYDLKLINFILLNRTVFGGAYNNNMSSRQKVDAPYFVELDPGTHTHTLYFDLGDGNAIGRVANVVKVGHTDKFISAGTKDGYHFINRRRDNMYLNWDEIVGDRKSHGYFTKWLDSLKIKQFEFDYYSNK